MYFCFCFKSSESVGARARLDAAQHRSLDERHRAGRIRHQPNEFSSINVVVTDAPSSASLLSNYELQSVDTNAVPNTEKIDESGVDVPAMPSNTCENVDRQQCAVKRRHGRLSPLSQPYTRGKNIRPSSSESITTIAGCSTKPNTYLHIVDDRRPISPPVVSSSGTARNPRRRQRSRVESKETEKSCGNNSDDEYDATRLRTLHQGINFEEVSSLLF